MAGIGFLSTAFGVSQLKQRSDYYDLAMSNRPLNSIEPERTRLIVEYIRGLAADSQKENKEIAEAQKAPMNSAIYSPESFADQEAMRSTLGRLATFTQIDFRYAAKLQAESEDFHRKMARCDPEYLKSWDAEKRDQDELEKSANQLERDWFISVNALYAYGEQHAREIKATDGKISISNPIVRQTFNDLLGRSKALHEQLETIVQQEVRNRQAAKAHIAR